MTLLVELPLDSITTPEWNPNEMSEAVISRLRQSIRRFGMVVPLVVRAVGGGSYESIGGAQPLAVLLGEGTTSVSWVVVEADDIETRLLAQALNHIAGEENAGLRADVVRHLLDNLPLDQVASILPDSAQSLQALASFGQEDIAEHLAAWPGYAT